MKILKILKFMIQNPTIFLLCYLICWISFSALHTLTDDPFIYGTLPDVNEEVRDSINHLPWSLWKLLTALSLIIEEIASDLSPIERSWIAFVPAFILVYIEARGNINGIANERKRWMDWYGQQQKAEELGISYEVPPVTDNDQSESYFIKAHKVILFRLRSPKRLFLHFVYWIAFMLFVSVILFINDGIVVTVQYIIKDLHVLVILAAILAPISCYFETRGFLKGIAAENQRWIKWYNRQRAAINHGANFEEPPSSQKVKVGSNSRTVAETVVFILRNPKSFFIHFTSWVFAVPILFIFLSISYNFYENWTIPSQQEIVEFYFEFCIPPLIFAIIMSYREAKGNLKGIVSEQQMWNKWYTQQQEAVPQETPFEKLSSFTNKQPDSYFITAERTLLSMLRKPYQFLLHLICWISGFVLVYGITDLFAIEELPDFAQILLVIILAFVSCYQETKGNFNGTNSQRQVWMDWYHRRQQAEEQEIQLVESPPMLEVFNASR